MPRQKSTKLKMMVRWKISTAIRAYEMCMTNGSEYALKFLQVKYPWFKVRNRDSFFQYDESYLICINSERHLAKIASVLDFLTENEKAMKKAKMYG
jgi:hypothetical protein